MLDDDNDDSVKFKDPVDVVSTNQTIDVVSANQTLRGQGGVFLKFLSKLIL